MEARKLAKTCKKSRQNRDFCHKKQERERKKNRADNIKKQAPEQHGAENRGSGHRAIATASER
jgi:hypothetical protein